MPTFAPRRALGRTGFVATAVGAGDLADRDLGVDACAAVLRRALDEGINVVDTAPMYEDGLSEQIVGRALEGRRESVFVIDKVDHFDRPLEPQLDGSIARLGFVPDAFVFHGVSKLEQWEALVAAGGMMAQLEGRVRFRGVSSHHPEVVRAAILSGTCDIVMFAVGPFVDRRYTSEMLPLAREKGVGVVSFKTFGAGKLVADTEGYGRPLTGPAGPKLTVEECVHATLTLDPDVALMGLSSREEQDAAFAACARFAPLARETLADVERRAAEAVQGKGSVWWDPPPLS